MCGILGALGPRDLVTEARLSAALGVMTHRGPDGQGLQDIPLRGDPSRRLLLGHRRLSIIDLSENGSQPMLEPRTANWITYNGEIYNYQSIKNRLLAQGITFRSSTDTEVLLALYSTKGLNAGLSELAGMFAFGIWDHAKQQLVLVRDHIGIKPLYYYSKDGVFLFASEVRALLATGLVPRRLDLAALPGYLEFGSVQGLRTMVQNVHALLPAQYLLVDADGSVSAPRTYWKPDFRPEPESIPVDGRVVTGLRDLLKQVISEHLIGDVPLGAFLSGGLDSSSIVALMAKVAPDRVATFSVTFKEKAFSEADYSRRMATYAGTRHEEIMVEESDFLAAVPNMLQAMDQPSVDGSNVYVISSAVRHAGLTVALSGQGGDEVFGGYPTFSRLYRLSKLKPVLQCLPPVWRQGVASALLPFLQANPQWEKLPDLMRSCASVPDSYGVIRAISSRSMRDGLLAGGMRNGSGHPGISWDADPSSDHWHTANLVSALEFGNYLPNTLLRDGDVMSMAHSLEIRVPFLDRRVIDYIAPISGTAKLPGAYSKPLLVDALKEMLPPEIYHRRKQGFTFPWVRWLRQLLQASVGQVLDRAGCGVDLGFAPGLCRDVWRLFLAGKGAPWTVVWALYTLIDWCSRNGVVLEDRIAEAPEPSFVTEC